MLLRGRITEPGSSSKQNIYKLLERHFDRHEVTLLKGFMPVDGKWQCAHISASVSPKAMHARRWYSTGREDELHQRRSTIDSDNEAMLRTHMVHHSGDRMHR